MTWLPLIMQILELAIPILGALVLWSLRRWLADASHAKHRELLAGMAGVAYLVVEQIARRTPGKLDDKLALAIKEIATQLGRPLTQTELAQAAALLKAQHEASRQKINM